MTEEIITLSKTEFDRVAVIHSIIGRRLSRSQVGRAVGWLCFLHIVSRYAPSVTPPLPKDALQRRGGNGCIKPAINLFNARSSNLCSHRLGQGTKALRQQAHQ